MKRIALFCMLFLPAVAWAQKQYYLPTAGATDDDKDKPMIEVYLPQQPNGCAVVLCPWRCHALAVVGKRRSEDGFFP